ncbi:MAG: glucoamylase family protein [Bryobacteraceae bacterium]
MTDSSCGAGAFACLWATQASPLQRQTARPSAPPNNVQSAWCFAFIAVFFLSSLARADTVYFERTFFDNSLTPDNYFYSAGKLSSPSSLTLIDGKLPVDTRTFFTPPNSLSLEWTSRADGGWEAEVRFEEWRNRKAFFPGETLLFHVYSPEGIRAKDLPRIALRDENNAFTQPLMLGDAIARIAARRWVQIKIPLDRFRTASVRRFDPHWINTICFLQGAADGIKHTLLIDEIRIDRANADPDSPPPAAPVHVEAKGYERHIDVSWMPAGEQAERYIVYRSLNNGPFRPVGIQVRGVYRYKDFLGKIDERAAYKLKACDRDYRESAFSETAVASTHAMSDDDLLTMVQEASFRYYWEGAPASGMTRENIPGNDDIVATGASGFGVMALIVGVDRRFIAREQGVQRLLKIADFLEHADRFRGAWAHFMNGATGRRMPVFSMFDNGADIVETSFLMEGLLSAREYFDGTTAAEQELRKRITRLWQGVEWDWFRRTPSGDTLFWHWSPEYSWYIDHRLYGWNEIMITYLLSIASPTHPVPASLYYTGWAGDLREFINGHTYYGIKLDLGTGTGGPLFFTHYSYMGFDPHDIRDRYAEYFENNRNMALINHAYCVANPQHHQGYGDACWGITAVDGPKGYAPYEPTPDMDDGTIAPTGALASFPYTPELSIKALKHFYRDLGDKLWDVYGFRDAFNLDENWFARINMGLNQAPVVVMIENYRTGLVWREFMKNPEIGAMISRLGLRQGR